MQHMKSGYWPNTYLGKVLTFKSPQKYLWATPPSPNTKEDRLRVTVTYNITMFSTYIGEVGILLNTIMRMHIS